MPALNVALDFGKGLDQEGDVVTGGGIRGVGVGMVAEEALGGREPVEEPPMGPSPSQLIWVLEEEVILTDAVAQGVAP